MGIVVISKARSRIASCLNCNAVIGYTANDVQAIHGRDISGGPDGCDFINCPECGKRIVLKSW